VRRTAVRRRRARPALIDGQVTLAELAGTVDLSTGSAVLLQGHILLNICAALA